LVGVAVMFSTQAAAVSFVSPTPGFCRRPIAQTRASTFCHDGTRRTSYLGCRPPPTQQRSILEKIKSGFRSGAARSPPPELVAPVGGSLRFDLLLGCVTATMFLGLVGISIGVLPAIMIPPNKVWLVLPVSQAYFHLAQVGLAPWVGASHAQTPSMPSNIWSGPVIFGMFSLLLIQACFSICMCKIGPRNGIAHVMYPPTTIYSLAWAYYYYKAFGKAPYVASDFIGLGFYPLHMVLWMCSTSVQCVLWNQIHHIQCVGGALSAFALPAPAILLAITMLWCGLLGSLDYSHGDLAPCPGERFITLNVLFNALSIASFLALVGKSTWPLRQSAAHYRHIHSQRWANEGPSPTPTHRAATAAARMLSRQFTGALWYVRISWLTFPLVWALAIFGYIGTERREQLYTACDLAAKFLPVSIYISLLSLQVPAPRAESGRG